MKDVPIRSFLQIEEYVDRNLGPGKDGSIFGSQKMEDNGGLYRRTSTSVYVGCRTKK